MHLFIYLHTQIIRALIIHARIRLLVKQMATIISAFVLNFSAVEIVKYVSTKKKCI